MEKISEAILNKVKAEAKEILNDAERRASEEVCAAEKRREERLYSWKNRMLEEARSEANRILARSSIKAKQELLLVKAGMIDELTGRIRQLLTTNSKKTGMPGLIKDSVKVIQSKKIVIYVAAKDVPVVKKIIDSDKELSGKITEVKECDCTGGLIAEDTDGKVRIDNTYETRLLMLLPRIIPDVSKELFGSS
ncbi:MAG: V-type ATP synthase subunit E [Chloroflexi bacterium]|nr:V-type ATP synthase subunit E [Chloroflexota bacterium]